MNSLKGEVPLKLADGREFVLVLDMEAWIAAEGVYGAPMAKLMADSVSGFVGAGRAILFGGMQAKHPEVTVREVGDMFGSDSEAINVALERAIVAAFPELDDDAEGKDGKNPPGPSSGRSGVKSARTTERSSAKPRARSS